MKLTKENYEAAQRFLDCIGYTITTLHLKRDISEKKFSGGKHFLTGKTGSSTLSFEGSLIDQPFLPDLLHLQKQNFGVFFMVNEGDGIIHPGKKTPRSQKSVQILKSCFIDTDKGDLQSAILKNVPFNFKVETSPGRYHLYFLLEDTEATYENVKKWLSIQRYLMNLHRLFDKSVADTSQLLRLPYFYHTKRDPFLITVERSTKKDRYTLDELIDLLDIQENPEHETEKFSFPTEKIAEGHRHDSQVAYLRHLTSLHPSISKESLELAAIGFAAKYYGKSKAFMPNGGDRYEQLVHNVDSVCIYRDEEERERELADTHEMNGSMTNGAYHEEDFHITEDFIRKCPNPLISKMVLDSASYARYPAPAFDFAAVLSLLACCKSHLYKTSDGALPILYSICAGPTGVGKTHSQTMVSDLLKRLGLDTRLQNGMASFKGLYRTLLEAGGAGLYLIDEVSGLLRAMANDRRAENYHKQLKGELLKFYSHGNRGFKIPVTGNEKDKGGLIPNPHLNFLGYSTPDGIRSAFNEEALTDGLLPRILFFSTVMQRVENPNHRPEKRWDLDVLEYFRSMVLKGKVKLESDFIEKEEAENAIKELREIKRLGKLTDPEKEELKKLSERLTELGADKIQAGKPEIIKYTPQAKALLKEYTKAADEKYNSDTKNPFYNLYTRSPEKVDRISLIISQGSLVKEADIQYAIEFMNLQHESMKAVFGAEGEALSQSYSAQSETRAIERVKNYLLKAGKEVTHQDVIRNVRPKEGSKPVKDAIATLIESGEIVQLKGEKGGKKYRLRHF